MRLSRRLLNATSRSAPWWRAVTDEDRVVSPSGRYVLAWVSGYDSADRPSFKAILASSGARTGPEPIGPDQHTGRVTLAGRYVLLCGDSPVTEGRLDRPVAGKVADNGTFILADRGFQGEESTLWGFNENGQQILRTAFTGDASKQGICITADGHYAGLFTHASPNRLTTFNLQAGCAIASWTPAPMTTACELTDDGQYIVIAIESAANPPPGLGPAPLLRYSLNGRFVDRKRWIAYRLHAGELGLIKHLLNGVGTKSNSRRLLCLLHATGCALQSSRQGSARAEALKLRGECLELLGELRAAQACYEAAFALNRKIGVKRRLNQLRKMFGRH